MKRAIRMAVLLVPFVVTLGWGNDSKKSQESKSQESYLKKAESEVQEWTAKLKSLQERSEKSGAKARQELDQHMKAVEDDLTVARKKLDELSGSSGSAWKSLRNGLDRALADIHREYRKATSFFNKNEKGEKKEKP